MWRILLFFILFAAVADTAYANGTNQGNASDICEGESASLKSAGACAKGVAGGAGYGTGETDIDVATIAGEIVSVVLSLLGILFLVLTIYGGFKWMIAGGNEEDVTKAKGIITNSIIGLAIVLGAFAIYTLVFQVLSGG